MPDTAHSPYTRGKIVFRPISDAEAVVAPLFDPDTSNGSEFTVSSVEGGAASLTQGWDGLGTRTSATTFEVTWNTVIDAAGFDAIRICLTMPPTASVSATIDADGMTIQLFSNVPGALAPIEATGRLEGASSQFTNPTLTIYNPTGREIDISFKWITLVNLNAERDMERNRVSYSKDWPDLLNLDGAGGVRGPLYLPTSRYEHLKSVLHDGRHEALLSGLREAATKWVAFDPEPEIRDYVPCVEHLYRYVRVADRGRTVTEEAMMLLAIAGYLCDRPDWSQRAARVMLSIAHTPHWFEGIQSRTPGSKWRHVCFMEDHYGSAMATALSFIGDCLTPAGVAMVLDGIETAVAVVDEKCQEPGYRWHMNQGLVGNRGRMIQALCLYYNGRGDKYAAMAEQAYMDHSTIMAGYLNDEGHAFEGPHYYGHYSLAASIQLWTAYSTYANKPIRTVVPDSVITSARYIEAMLSTTDPQGATCPVNQSGVGDHAVLPSLTLGFLASTCGWAKGRDLLAYRHAHSGAEARHDASGLDTLLELHFDSEAMSERPAADENLMTFPKSGLVAYRFKSHANGKLWFLCERNAKAGHHHFDRGSIVLENSGEALLVDPGVTNYSHPSTGFMKLPSWHNMAYVDGESMALYGPADECAKLEYAVETENGVRFSGDISPVLGGLARLARRAGELTLTENGGTITLTDTWAFHTPQALSIAFQSYVPWEISGNVAVASTATQYVRVTSVSEGSGGLAFGQDDTHIDGNTRQIFTIHATVGPSDDVEIISTVVFGPLDNAG